ncbi:MAG: hypothetical protein JXO22_11525 [Phycisphaerae bacterium]|nr:hypothetical protein [Phycisphaerae bacterium]
MTVDDALRAGPQPPIGLSDAEISLHAGYVLAARRKGCVIEPLSDLLALSRADAERLRDAILRFRLVRERAVGWRIESGAAPTVHDRAADYGMVARHVLTNRAVIPAHLRGGRAFADIRLIMNDHVSPHATAAEALRAIDSVGLALSTVEWIVEPRETDTHDGVATDTVSPAWVSVGPTVPVGRLATSAVSVKRNGVVVAHGTPDRAVGEFGRSLVVLAGHLAKIGQRISRGATVLVSWMPAGVALSPGDCVEVYLADSLAMSYRCGEG